MKNFKVVFCLFLAVLCMETVNSSKRERERCFIELTRVVGHGSSYAVTCKCDAIVAKSLVFSNAPPEKHDTVGRGMATLRCIKEREEHLITMCNRLDDDSFVRHVTPILKWCVNEIELTAEEAKQTDPYSFDATTCETKFGYSPAESQSSAAWLCECRQSELLEVLPGWARYKITGITTGMMEALRSLQSCSGEAKEQLNEVCKHSPGNFDILALHIMQTCCKRARVESDSKFECAAVVPQDLSNLKTEFKF